MQQLGGLDAIFLYLERPHAPNQITTLGIYDPSTAPGGRITFDMILANIERRLHLARSFRQKAVRVPMDLDRPYWIEDAEFDLEFHVRHSALPEPGDWSQLCLQVAQLHSRALDPTRPLWEAHVIEGLNDVDGIADGAYAVVWKVHHAAIDGVAGAEMITAIHDLTPEAEPAPPEGQWEPEQEPSTWSLLGRAARNNAATPLRLARVLGQTVPALRHLPSKLRRGELRLPSSSVPRTRFNGRVTAHRAFEARRFGLDDVKKMRSSVPGATVNDSALAVVGGAMRKYLSEKGDLPPQSLVAMVPISVRAKGEQGATGNRLSMMTVPLGTDIADPVERLAAVTEVTKRSRQLNDAIGARALTEYSQFIPGGLVGLAGRGLGLLANSGRGGVMCNTVVTNVPGPQVSMYSGGARLAGLYGLGPILDGVGLMHIISSYHGAFNVSVTACREMLPDAAWYAECIEESFRDQLKGSA
jgi:diacylglycerol O-acyltransferase / wax synthase